MAGQLFLIRGLPGSGKSTTAKALADWWECVTLEADMFFMVKGKYEFDPARIKLAHGWCQNEARKYLKDGTNVIVANTFTQKWEMQPYIDMEYASLQIIECKGQFQNVHGVPKQTIAKMAERWENL